GQRELTSGIPITWRMLFPTYDHTTDTLPFLIEWDQPEHERINVGLVNPYAIKKIDFSATSIDKILHIYNIVSKKRLRYSVRLKNTTLAFKEDVEIQLTTT